MPGKSEKMTGVGGINDSGAKGVWVAGASGSKGESEEPVPQAERIIKTIRKIRLLPLNPYCVPSTLLRAGLRNFLLAIHDSQLSIPHSQGFQMPIPSDLYPRREYPAERVWGLLHLGEGRRGA